METRVRHPSQGHQLICSNFLSWSIKACEVHNPVPIHKQGKWWSTNKNMRELSQTTSQWNTWMRSSGRMEWSQHKCQACKHKQDDVNQFDKSNTYVIADLRAIAWKHTPRNGPSVEKAVGPSTPLMQQPNLGPYRLTMTLEQGLQHQ